MQVGLSSQYTCQNKQISSWPCVPVLPVRGIQLAATSDCSSKGTGQCVSIYFKKRKKKTTQNTSHTWVCSASWANTIMHISAFLKKKKGRQISVQPLEAIAVTFRLALQRDAGQGDWIWLLVAAPLGTAGEAELRGQNFPLIRGKSPTQMVYRIDYRG